MQKLTHTTFYVWLKGENKEKIFPKIFCQTELLSILK